MIYTALDFLRLRKLALYLEDLWGGRVGVLQPPNQVESDPFIMLVHHRHTVRINTYMRWLRRRPPRPRIVFALAAVVVLCLDSIKRGRLLAQPGLRPVVPTCGGKDNGIRPHT